jgi:hypothetical protein
MNHYIYDDNTEQMRLMTAEEYAQYESNLAVFLSLPTE